MPCSQLPAQAASDAGSRDVRPGVDATRTLHESLIEMLPDAVLALDVESERVAIANLAAERLLGMTRAQLARLSLRDLAAAAEVLN